MSDGNVAQVRRFLELIQQVWHIHQYSTADLVELQDLHHVVLPWLIEEWLAQRERITELEKQSALAPEVAVDRCLYAIQKLRSEYAGNEPVEKQDALIEAQERLRALKGLEVR